MPLISAAADFLRLGNEHHRQGRLDQAEALYRRALEVDPVSADGLHLVGVLAHQQGDHETAVHWIRRAIAVNGSAATYYSNLGVAYRSLGRAEEAIAALRKAETLDGRSPGIAYNLANALKDAELWHDAAEAFRRSLAADANNAEAWTGLGDALRNIGDFDGARRSHGEALDLQPSSVAALYNLGLTWKDDENFDEAATCFLKAACLDPDFVDAQLNLGNVYEDVGDFGRAIAAYNRALRLDPDRTAARFNRALAGLRQGNLVEGWRDYESRWQHNGKARRFPQPEWDGSPDPGKTLLIYGEQGIGDEILFASCYPESLDRCGRCVIECEPRLVPLFRRSFPAATVFPRTVETDPADLGRRPDWDCQIAAGSLPRRLRTTFASFPTHTGYLLADPERAREWGARYERLGAGMVVGISWRGGKDPATRRRRSTSLEQWKPLFAVPGVAFVSLQYGDCAAEISACEKQFGISIHHWDDSDPLNDMEGFAAQVAALDLVISVDNSNVHLAGALGRPVWALLHSACDWRWFSGRDDSPWYPSARLFRQPSTRNLPGERWKSVFEQAAAALRHETALRAEQYSGRAVQLHTNGRLPEAIDAYQRALALRPGDGQLLNDLGAAWKAGGRADRAIAAYQQSIECDPRASAAWFNLGNAHREENRLEQAIECYRRAEKIIPEDSRVLVNLSVALKERRRLDEALECLDRVLGRQPELPEARFDRSLIYLLRGDLARGWDEYEWRLTDRDRQRRPESLRWNGSSLADRTLHLLAEQGLGDQVMFASCIGELTRQAKKCSVECDPRLVRLYERSFPGIAAVPHSADQRLYRAEECDVVDYVGSLPLFVRRRIEDFPKAAGFLVPDPAAVAGWKSRLARLGGALKVGISWRGGKDAETQKKRSLSLDCWQSILQVPGVRFVNLQHGLAAAEAAIVRERFGIALDDGTDCDPLCDLDEFVAKISALDLVISVDNSNVHLAAALGRPVWTLLPFSSDWRWMLEGETTPWYPTMRLFRCASPGGWGDVVRRAAQSLAQAAFG